MRRFTLILAFGLLVAPAIARETLPPETRYALRIMRSRAKAQARVQRIQFRRYGRVLTQRRPSPSCNPTQYGRYAAAYMSQRQLDEMFLEKVESANQQGDSRPPPATKTETGDRGNTLKKCAAARTQRSSIKLDKVVGLGR